MSFSLYIYYTDLHFLTILNQFALMNIFILYILGIKSTMPILLCSILIKKITIIIQINIIDKQLKYIYVIVTLKLIDFFTNTFT